MIIVTCLPIVTEQTDSTMNLIHTATEDGNAKNPVVIEDESVAPSLSVELNGVYSNYFSKIRE